MDSLPAEALLAWYDKHARRLPWRVPPAESKRGIKADPYEVWLSEVMLQQTQVATVRDFFLKFTQTWPKVGDLASADTDDVMKAWAGLGYYSRARNLKKCAEKIAFEMDSRFPRSAIELKQLPGIGDYTAAAIAAIAFGERTVVVDGNIERVSTRLFRIGAPVREAKPLIRSMLEPMVPADRPGDFAQAMMDLGATVCTPKRPACALCPINAWCEAFKQGDPESFPQKDAKKAKPVRKGAAFVIERDDGAIWLKKRPASGLLGGMTEVPGTNWNARQSGSTGSEALPFDGHWQKAGTAKHSFTHFQLELEVWHLNCPKTPESEGWWSRPEALSGEALPTVMKKVIDLVRPGTFGARRRHEKGSG